MEREELCLWRMKSGASPSTHSAPPPGPVRELWRIQHPLNDSVPFPEGIESLEQWSMTTISMQKYSGITFGQLLEKIIAGDRGAIQSSSWLVQLLSPHHSKWESPVHGLDMKT